jgi:glycosyltransferase involved in cell wall biosynthesis
MKVLFVSREKVKGKISPVVYAQANSLYSYVNLSLFSIEGRGWRSYLKGISGLREYLRVNEIDIVHAHYSYSGMLASLATRKPIVISLMGSDIEDHWMGRVLIRIFSKFSWKAVIMKSRRSKTHLGLKKAHIIPNGVNLELFKPLQADEARKKAGLQKDKRYILFLSHPDRREKNYALASEAVNILNDEKVKLMALYDKPHHEIPIYLSASDVLLLTSHFEGSPNAVKEAMACNCPVVSTDVGDVKEVIGDTEGCYITSFKPEDVAEKLKQAIDFGKRTRGREEIQHLDSKIIAKKLIKVYKQVLKV